MREVWYTGVDQGDGSVGVGFYESRECIEKLEEFDPEAFRGEGGQCFYVSDDAVFEQLHVATMQEVDEYIEEVKSYR